MKVKYLGLMLLFMLLCCKNKGQEEFAEGEGGMLYKIHHDESGPPIQLYDFMAVTTVEKTDQDSIIYNMYDYDARPTVIFRDKSVFKGDLQSAFGMLSEGDSATFKIRIDSMALAEGKPISNAKDNYRIYTIKVNKVMPRGNLNDSLMNAQIELYRKSIQHRAMLDEPKKISQFIATNKLKPKITASGMYYVIEKQGAGKLAETGDTLKIKYTGKYFSGKVFYTTDSALARKSGIFNPETVYGAIAMVAKKQSGTYSSSFEEAAMMFSKGTIAKLIVPSRLNYRNKLKKVLEHAPVVAEIEIVDVRRRQL